MYRIKAGQRAAAKKLGVAIRPSTASGKKSTFLSMGSKSHRSATWNTRTSGPMSRTNGRAASQKERLKNVAASIAFAMPRNASLKGRPDIMPAESFGDGTQARFDL